MTTGIPPRLVAMNDEYLERAANIWEATIDMNFGEGASEHIPPQIWKMVQAALQIGITQGFSLHEDYDSVVYEDEG